MLQADAVLPGIDMCMHFRTKWHCCPGQRMQSSQGWRRSYQGHRSGCRAGYLLTGAPSLLDTYDTASFKFLRAL